MMGPLRMIVLVLMVVALTASCSVISQEVRSEAEPPVPFKTLAHESDRYSGKTVILGGYIIETRNHTNETIIEVLQAPLASQDRPKSRDLSEGRLIVSHDGFLDPEIYRKDREITVAGTLIDCTVEQVETCRVKSREIYLWPEEDTYRYPYPYPYGYYWGPVLRPSHRHHRHRHYPYYPYW